MFGTTQPKTLDEMLAAIGLTQPSTPTDPAFAPGGLASSPAVRGMAPPAPSVAYGSPPTSFTLPSRLPPAQSSLPAPMGLTQASPAAAAPAAHKGFFGSGGFQRIAGILGPALLGASNPALGASLIELLAKQREGNAQRQADMYKTYLGMAKPQYDKVGNNLVQINPMAGTANSIFQGQSDAENYAASLGLQQGTPEYTRALQDYALKDVGPTSMGLKWTQQGEARRHNMAGEGLDSRRVGLEGARVGLEGRRVGIDQQNANTNANRATQLSPSDVVGPLYAKMAAGIPLTPAEQQTLNTYRTPSPEAMLFGGMGAGGMPAPPMTGQPTAPAPQPRPVLPTRTGKGGGSVALGQTATGPDGHKIVWNGSTWVPAS